MSATLPPPELAVQKNYLNADYGWKSWLFTTDHKRIALLYLFSITAFFFVGGLFAVGMRINLLSPSGVFAHDTYNKLFTMHGIIMVFFLLVPSIPATLGNFLIPIMIGARDLAFPRINLLSWYIYIGGGVLALTAIVRGGVDTGWTFYAPFSSTYSNTHVILAALGVFIAGFSSILTGLNFIVTIHTMRCPGMTWSRLPLFVWGHYATAIIQVLGTPVLAITILLLGLERLLHAGIFDPALGGDPVLFQHLFWFYSHPAVYIMILPGMAVMSELVACFSRKAIFGYSFVAFSSVAIAVLGFRKTQKPSPVAEVHVVWITAGLGCDGDSVSITAATQPSIEDVILGAIPGLPKVYIHNPIIAYENGDEFLKFWYMAAEGKLEKPEVEFEWKIPQWSNARARSRALLRSGLRGRGGAALRGAGAHGTTCRAHENLD
jgi:hypothetical protein